MANKALVIGVWKYHDHIGITPLHAVEEDLNAFCDLLRNFGDFERNEVRPLPNPTQAEANTAIANLFNDSQPSDKLLLYYSGHGFRHVEHGTPDLCLALPETSGQEPQNVCIEGRRIRNLIRSERCGSKNIVVILDCCFAGAIGEDQIIRKGAQASANQEMVETTFQYNNEGNKEGAFVLCASTVDQPAFERRRSDDPSVVESLFTKTLVDGLKKGEVSPESERLNINDLHAYAVVKARESGLEYTPNVIQLRNQHAANPFTFMENPVPPLPQEVMDALRNSDKFSRLGAVCRLDGYLDTLEPETSRFKYLISCLKKRLEISHGSSVETDSDVRQALENLIKKYEQPQQGGNSEETSNKLSIATTDRSFLSDSILFLAIFSLSLVFFAFFSVTPGGVFSQETQFVIGRISGWAGTLPSGSDLATVAQEFAMLSWCYTTTKLKSYYVGVWVVAFLFLPLFSIWFLHRVLKPSLRLTVLIAISLGILGASAIIKIHQTDVVRLALVELQAIDDALILEEKSFLCNCSENLVPTISEPVIWSYILGLTYFLFTLTAFVSFTFLYLAWRFYKLLRQGKAVS